MFIKKITPLALLLCLGLVGCEKDRVSPPENPNLPTPKATEANTETEEAAANSPREDKEVSAPERKADKEPVKLSQKMAENFAKHNNTKQKVTYEVDSGDEWQYTTMTENQYNEYIQSEEKNLYWYADDVDNSKNWNIVSTPIDASSGINWNSTNKVLLLRKIFCTNASYKYSNPQTTMHARYTGKMDVYINNVLVYSDKDKLPNTGDKYTEIKFDKAPIVVTDLNTISVKVVSKEDNNNFDMAIDLQGDQINDEEPAPPKADAKAPAAPPKADAKAPAAPPKAAAKAPANK